jgi:Glycosyl hydrolases family 2, TIM barrel domain
LLHVSHHTLHRTAPAWLAAAAIAASLCISSRAAERPSAASPSDAAPIKVEVGTEHGRFVLLRGGRPYAVRGAGGTTDLETLAAHGGNSLRTWSTDNGQEVLDEAARYGLTVALCIDIGRERHGFDYDDAHAVAAQLEHAREEVRRYKDHPALLAWIIGNEPNLFFENPKVFDAIDGISRMIHEVDGNHPTTTALAGFSAELADLVAQRAKDLDFISIQMYGDIVNLPRYLETSGFDQPYLVTEWGAVGHWEVPTTAWGAPIEQDSSEKARSYLAAYETALAADPEQMMGSYVFLWGQKQERTPTWYGMFLADGSETETIDVMHYLWNGTWPANRAPRVGGMLLDTRTAGQSVVIVAGETYEASVDALDPDGDALDFRWEILRESTATQQGGDREAIPETLPGLVADSNREQVRVTAPPEPGVYRLFVYAYDGKGNAGHANLPFRVSGRESAENK